MPKRDLEEWVDVVLATGYRNGEVLALRWLDLDLVSPTPTAHVCGTVVEPRGDYVKHIHRQGETKSISGRTLILPQHLVDLFGARAMRGGHTRPEDPVFGVSALRMLGRFCSLKVGPLRCWSLCRVLGSGGWQCVDAGVFEAVGAAFEGMTSAWWTMRSIIAAATTCSPKTSPPRAKGRLLVRISEACS